MTSSAFTFAMHGFDLRFRKVALVHREWLTDSYVRVRLQGDQLRGFDSRGSDDHVRVFFPDGDPETVDELRAAPSREYTPLFWGDDWLELEFAVHSGAGIGGPWAATAQLGSIAGVGGPRGSKVLEGQPDAWFLAGDETAVPAIRRFVQLMPATATGHILVEVPDASRELSIDVPVGVTVRQVHRGDAAPSAPLIARLEELTAADRPNNAVLGFIAAEQSVVKPGRALLLDRWGLDADSVIVKGYWKRGDIEYHAPH
ncbi:siderophore-interacting protein [Microbacterium marmarense]|uniref:Siderophore-interacting protein n=1 Tax=Microbacterium marmarense TaxID=3122051 RepID=A0ABU8LRI6_9MICO